MSDVAKNIKKFRQQRNWTQDRLAQELHVTRQAVSSWETGKNEPDIGMLESISRAMQVDLTELLYGRKGPGKYPQFQKKAVVWVVVLGILAVIALLDLLVLIPWGRDVYRVSYDGRLLDVSRWVIPTICLAAIGMLIPAIVSLWRNVRLTGRARVLLKIAAIALLIPVVYYMIGMSCYIFGRRPIFEKLFSFLMIEQTPIRWRLVEYVLPVLGGLCLYPAFFAPGGVEEESEMGSIGTQE